MARKKGQNEQDISFELLDEDAKIVVSPEKEKQQQNSEKVEKQKQEKEDNHPAEVKPKSQPKPERVNNAQKDDFALQTELEEYKSLLQLSRAEFDNYRKRSYSLLQNAKLEGELNVIIKFLPALDAFEKAKDMISDVNVKKGIEMIEKDLKEKLKGLGVAEMKPLGKKFDANLHNALSTTCDPSKEDEIVTQVYQEGYTYNDKVIRYAQVIINKK